MQTTELKTGQKKYVRKTKDVYTLIWNAEEIDSSEDWADAKYLKNEYNLAYGGGVTIKNTREKI